MRRLFTSVLFFTVAIAGAQDLTGVWQGHFRSGNMASRSSVFDDRYKFEVQIAQHDKLLEAVTYSYLSSLFYGKAAATGTVNPKNNKVLLQEGKLMEVRNQSGDVCIMTCFLQYTKIGEEEYLEGNYVSMNVRDSSNCGRGAVFLRKVSSSDFYKEPFLQKKEEELARIPEKKPVTPPPARSSMPRRDSTLVKAPPARTPKPRKDSTLAKAPPARTLPPRKDSAVVKAPAAKTSQPGATVHTAPKKASKPSPGDKAPAPAPMARVTTPQAAQPQSKMDSMAGVGKKFAVITPRVLLSRSNQLVKTIVVNTNEVVLNIYDDGAIDHDTISVYLDKKQVINHAMLTDRPLVLTLHLDESEDYHELVMVAENEGEIPPNTSLMIVKAGDKEYEVRITSTEQKNAVVVFKYEKLK